MNWVAIDLGSSTIKASVLDKLTQKPVRLTYSIGGYETTLLSSVVYITDDGTIILGEYASMLGIQNSAKKEVDGLHHEKKFLIAKAIFEQIKKAAKKHYSDSDIGVILLTNTPDFVDEELEELAKTIFKEVKTTFVGAITKNILSPVSKLMLIVDFGERAFRVTLQDQEKMVFQNSNSELGFSYFDILALVECEDISSYSILETELLTQILQRIKIWANNGENFVLPKCLEIQYDVFLDAFEQKMKKFLYQCFEECTNTLKAASKSWKDVDDIVFIGGVAQSILLESSFKQYMQNMHNHQIETYNSKNNDFDVLFATVNCAILNPNIKNVGSLIVKDRGNRI